MRGSFGSLEGPGKSKFWRSGTSGVMTPSDALALKDAALGSTTLPSDR